MAVSPESALEFSRAKPAAFKLARPGFYWKTSYRGKSD